MCRLTRSAKSLHALRRSQAQPIPKIALLGNSVQFALLAVTESRIAPACLVANARPTPANEPTKPPNISRADEHSFASELTFLSFKLRWLAPEAVSHSAEPPITPGTSSFVTFQSLTFSPLCTNSTPQNWRFWRGQDTLPIFGVRGRHL